MTSQQGGTPRALEVTQHGEAQPQPVSPTASDYPARSAMGPAATALQSVENAIRVVQHDVQTKKDLIDDLGDEQLVLEQNVVEAKEQLQHVQQSLEEKNFLIQEANQRNAELFRSLSAEQGAFAALKDEVAKGRGKKAFLEQQNSELLEQNEDEAAVRRELKSGNESTNELRAQLEQDKAKYKQVFKELQAKLRIEMDTFMLEQLQWEGKELQLTKSLREETEALDENKLQTAQLASSVLKLSDQSQELQEIVTQQQHRLEAITEEFNQATAHKQALAEANQDLIKNSADAIKSKANTDKELERSAEQLRVMAEKVFHLLSQLQKMDEWKVEFLERKRDTQDKVLSMRDRCETFTEHLEEMNGEKELLNLSHKESEDELQEQRKELMALKREFVMLEKQQTVLRKKINLKDATLHTSSQKHFHVTERLAHEKGQARKEQKMLRELSGRVEELGIACKSLKSQIGILELATARHQSMIKKSQMQLDQWAEKDAYFAKLESMLDARKKAMKRSTPEEDNNEPQEGDEGKVRVQQPLLRIKKLLKGRHNAVRVLKKFNLTETMLTDWVENPPKLMYGLHRIYTLCNAIKQDTVAGRRENAQCSERVKGMRAKDRELKGLLFKSREHRSKGYYRLVELMNLHKAQRNGEKKIKMLEVIDLEDNGIEDRDVEMLCGVLNGNKRVKVIKLRANRITGQGLLPLAAACMAPTNNVREVDLQQNQVTLDEFEALAHLVLDTSLMPPQSARSQPSQDGDDDTPRDALVKAAGTMSALLRTENKSVLPIIEATTADKAVMLDLRYNRLQQRRKRVEDGDDGQLGIKATLAFITEVLAGCGNDQGRKILAEKPNEIYEDWKEQNEVLDPADGMWNEMSDGELDNSDEFLDQGPADSQEPKPPKRMKERDPLPQLQARGSR